MIEVDGRAAQFHATKVLALTTVDLDEYAFGALRAAPPPARSRGRPSAAQQHHPPREHEVLVAVAAGLIYAYERGLV